MNVRENLLKLFNQYHVVQDDETKEIAKHFNFKFSSKDGVWVSLPRIIGGEKISSLFKRFLDQYNKHYRVDVAAKEFYQLTDDEIQEMFDELPHYLETFQGKEIYKPNAASFLKERIWKQDYPGKKKRHNAPKLSVNQFDDWDSYIARLPEQSKSFAEAYRDLISFNSFKAMVNGNQESN